MKKLMDFLSKHRKAFMLLFDVCGMAIAMFMSRTLLPEGSDPHLYYIQSAICAAACLCGLYVFGVYQKLWFYARTQDFASFIFGYLTGSTVAVLGMAIIWSGFSSIVLQTLIIFVVLSTVASIIIRILYKYLKTLYVEKLNPKTKKRVMIVGGGGACQILLLEMLAGKSEYKPVCIVDDDKAKIGCTINGVKIIGTTDDIPAIVEKKNIEEIILAIPSASSEQRAQITEKCSGLPCEVKTVPPMREFIEKGGMLNQIHNIQIEELLGRPPIDFDYDEVNSLVKGKVCMVTGGGGSIGSELCRQIVSFNPKKLIIVDIYENNAYDIQQELKLNHDLTDIELDVYIASVRDFDKMEMLFNKFKPSLVFHAAAHKHVPLMETSPEEAVKNNVIGTYNVATLAQKYGCDRFVMISTDKAVNPTNVMGATKRCCEMIIQYMSQQTTGTDFVAVRFGNVLGSNGSVIPLFKSQIESGGPVTVTHPDVIRYFMMIPEAVSLVLQAGAMANGGEIFVLDMGKPVKIVTLAEKMIKMYGKKPYEDIAIEFIGLRPGEKLFEELLMDEEGLKPTCNNKIFIGNLIDIEPESFMKDFEQIRSAATNNETEVVVKMLEKMVPTFNHLTHENDEPIKNIG